jgi:hypothetical protein
LSSNTRYVDGCCCDVDGDACTLLAEHVTTGSLFDAVKDGGIDGEIVVKVVSVAELIRFFN